MRQILIAVSLALIASTVAFAHAHLESTTPAADAILPTAPAEVAIVLSEEIEPKFSTIEVTDAHGTRVDKDDVHLASDNAKRLIVSLQPLDPGSYKVDWKVTSVDTHKTHGSFSFKVAS
ncbi:MAG: copper homeostasis periplasmic binding protein CopC [Methyloceanibacter sp.]